ncbi:hypothetical protein SO802_020121 [Lithocarpus litseifolius]|uniref:Protein DETOXIFICATION n=1 Tax=Lithocarpus litseifolius TaxID=425828 RepID=A0AAW2CAX4_9ROSI
MQQEPPSHSTSIGPSSGIDPPHVQAEQAVGLPAVLKGRLKRISKAPPYGTGGHKHGHKAGPEASDERHARPPPHYTRKRKVNDTVGTLAEGGYSNKDIVVDVISEELEKSDAQSEELRKKMRGKARGEAAMKSTRQAPKNPRKNNNNKANNAESVAEAVSTSMAAMEIVQYPSKDERRIPICIFFKHASRQIFKLDELGSEIAQIAVPVALALAANPIASLIDIAFIGQIGTVELAAVGVSIALFNQVSRIAIFPLVNVTTSFVAEEDAIGSVSHEAQDCEHLETGSTMNGEDKELIPKNGICENAYKSQPNSGSFEVVKIDNERRHISSALSALVIGSILGLIQAIFLIFGAKPLLGFMGDCPMLTPAQQYLTLRSLGAPAVLLSLAMQGAILASAFAKKDYKKAEAAASRVFQLGLVLGFILATIVGVGLHFGARLFTKDVHVLHLISRGIPFVAATQPINALAFVFDGINFGASDFAYSAYSMASL